MLQRPTSAQILRPLGLAICLSLFGDLTLYTVLVTQLDELGLTLAGVGVLLSVNRLVRIPGNPLTGLLLDRLGRRPIFISGMLLGVLSTASYGLTRGFWPFLGGRLAWGIAWTCINVGGRAMLLDVSTPSNRGRLTGIYNTWLQAGFVLSPLVGGFLVDTISFRPSMLVCAGLTAVGLAVAVLAVPETAKPHGREAHCDPRVAPRAAVQRWLHGCSVPGIRRVVRSNRVLVTVSLLLLIVLFAGHGVALSTTSLLLQQRLGRDVVVGCLTLGVGTAGGILLALRSLLAGIVGPLVGHLSDTYIGRWPVIVSSLVIGAAGFGLLSVAASPATIVLGVSLAAVSGGAALATLGAQAGDLTPSGREGAVMGAYATVGDIGSWAGPLVAFAMLSVVSLGWVYLLCVLCFLVGLLLIWRLGPRAETRHAPGS